MTNYKTVSIVCEECGNRFEGDLYNYIDGKENPELVDRLRSGELFNHTCPKCNHVNEIRRAFKYVDSNKGVLICCTNVEDILLEKDELLEEVKNLEEKTNIEHKLYATSDLVQFNEIYDCIIAGYNPKAIMLYKEYLKLTLAKHGKIDYNKTDVIAAIVYGVLKICVIKNYDDKGVSINDVNINIYNKTMAIFKDFLDNDKFLIYDVYSIKKLVSWENEASKEEAKIYNYEFVVTKDHYNKCNLAFVQTLNEGKFQEGDFILVIRFDKKGKRYLSNEIVENIFHMTDYDFPYEINKMPVAACKIDCKPIVATNNPNDELDENEKYRLQFKAFKANKSNMSLLPIDFFNNHSAIICYKMVATLDPEEFSEAVEKENLLDLLKRSEIKEEFDSLTKDDKNYLAVYLNQSDVASPKHSKLIYSVRDILKIFYAVAYKYDGICINPGKEEIILSANDILDYEFDRIMTCNSKMEEFLISLSDKEIEYIGEHRYQTICDIYVNKIPFEEIKNKYNLSKEDLDDRLGRGYALVKNVISTRLLTDNKGKEEIIQ